MPFFPSLSVFFPSKLTSGRQRVLPVRLRAGDHGQGRLHARARVRAAPEGQVQAGRRGGDALGGADGGRRRLDLGRAVGGLFGGDEQGAQAGAALFVARGRRRRRRRSRGRGRGRRRRNRRRSFAFVSAVLLPFFLFTFTFALRFLLLPSPHPPASSQARLRRLPHLGPARRWGSAGLGHQRLWAARDGVDDVRDAAREGRRAAGGRGGGHCCRGLALPGALERGGSVRVGPRGVREVCF